MTYSLTPGADDVRAILIAYHRVVSASWPALHPEMTERSCHWPSATEQELKAELADYVAQASRPSNEIRLFWKIGARFQFGGANVQFVRDAGLNDVAELRGLTDFDGELPWTPQAAKYRLDDESIVQTKVPKLDIIERQQSTNGAIGWVRVGKAPIERADGTVIGVLGMYEVLDAETGRKLHAAQPHPRVSRPSTSLL